MMPRSGTVHPSCAASGWGPALLTPRRSGHSRPCPTSRLQLLFTEHEAQERLLLTPKTRHQQGDGAARSAGPEAAGSRFGRPRAVRRRAAQTFGRTREFPCTACSVSCFFVLFLRAAHCSGEFNICINNIRHRLNFSASRAALRHLTLTASLGFIHTGRKPHQDV